jgi:hypothetical protein
LIFGTSIVPVGGGVAAVCAFMADAVPAKAAARAAFDSRKVRLLIDIA